MSSLFLSSWPPTNTEKQINKRGEILSNMLMIGYSVSCYAAIVDIALKWGMTSVIFTYSPVHIFSFVLFTKY
jgi:hypothetical protein